jgi:hypothetical protein
MRMVFLFMLCSYHRRRRKASGLCAALRFSRPGLVRVRVIGAAEQIIERYIERARDVHELREREIFRTQFEVIGPVRREKQAAARIEEHGIAQPASLRQALAQDA